MGLSNNEGINAQSFTATQREYITKTLVDCWKRCHDEHCHKGHDCKNDVNDLIGTLARFGLSHKEIYTSVLGVELDINL